MAVGDDGDGYICDGFDFDRVAWEGVDDTRINLLVTELLFGLDPVGEVVVLFYEGVVHFLQYTAGLAGLESSGENIEAHYCGEAAKSQAEDDDNDGDVITQSLDDGWCFHGFRVVV